MKILSRRKRKEIINYNRRFWFKQEPDRGYSFECDKNGIPFKNYSTYAECLTGFVKGKEILDEGIVEDITYKIIPAIGKCECGGEVMLSGFTNTCKCGADYNSSGQRLASREQWGEETGESLSEILAVDCESP